MLLFFWNIPLRKKFVRMLNKNPVKMMILSVIYVYYPMLMMETKWSSVNDVIVVYIKIVTGYPLFQVGHGFVDLVRLFDDQLVFFVQSRTFENVNEENIEDLFL